MLFTTLRPFTDAHVALIQRNAIGRWLTLEFMPQTFSWAARRRGRSGARIQFVALAECRTNEEGMLMRSSMCQLARHVAEHELLCMINGGIIIPDNPYKALKRVRLTQFVAVGRTYNLKIHGEIDFIAKLT